MLSPTLTGTESTPRLRTVQAVVLGQELKSVLEALCNEKTPVSGFCSQA